MVRFTVLLTALLVVTGTTSARGQDTNEVKRLKERIELLEAKLKLAEKENELYKKEVDLLKASAGKEHVAKPGSENDTVPGAGAIGNEEDWGGSKIKAKLGDDVEYELIKCVRDPKKLNQVAFTFCLKSEAGVSIHMAPHQLSLTDHEGAPINVKVVNSPRLGGDFMGTPRLIFDLPKGQEVRFQIIVTGIPTDIKSIQRVELTGPPRGFVNDRVTFTNVKVVSKK